MSGHAGFARGESRQDFETPADFMGAVVKRFGVMTCDLAATEANTKAQIWYGPDSRMLTEMDSLQVDWHRQRGNLWLNPPFANIEPWAAKCAKESSYGARIFLLTPASVGSNWFQNNVFGKARVFFLNGRLTFVGCEYAYPKDCILSVFEPLLSETLGGPGFECWNWRE